MKNYKPMADNFLNNDRLATLEEIRYLLLEILDPGKSKEWYDLSVICKEMSLNFAFSFENTMSFLHLISLIEINNKKEVTRSDATDLNKIDSDAVLREFLFLKTLSYLKGKELYQTIFGDETIELRDPKDQIAFLANKMPVYYPFIKALFLNLEIGSLDESIKDKILINDPFASLLKHETAKSKAAENHSEKLSTQAKSFEPPTFFISYASEDRDYKDELIKHLSGLKRNGLIKDWEGRAILPGQAWDEEIKKKLEEAEVILFLVSSDFMASDYIHDVEIKRALERYKKKEVRIIPIILRHCDFNSLQISMHQALPEYAKPINTWTDKDEAYLNIVTQIKKIIGFGKDPAQELN